MHRRCAVLGLAWLLAFPGVGRAQSYPELDRFVIENGLPEQVVQAEGEVRLTGRAVVRTRRIVGDFTLATDFRLGSAESWGGVGIRALHASGGWPNRGYALDLRAGERPELQARNHDLGRSAEVPGPLLTERVWHRLTISATGPLVRIDVDGIGIGTYEIQMLAGSLVFESMRGSVEFRNLDIRPVPTTAPRPDALKAGPGTHPPQLTREVKAHYPVDAMRRKVEGVVIFEAIVMTDGTIGAVTLKKPLDPEIEHHALAAVRRWEFASARFEGTPVPCLVEIEMAFALGDHLRKR